MFGGKETQLKSLATALSSICPLWDARIMRFNGGLDAVILNRMPSSRTALFVQGGQWQDVLISLDSQGNVFHTEDPMPLGKRARDVGGVAHLTVQLNVEMYRAVLGISDDPIAALQAGIATEEERAWARRVLPYLTVSGR